MSLRDVSIQISLLLAQMCAQSLLREGHPSALQMEYGYMLDNAGAQSEGAKPEAKRDIGISALHLSLSASLSLISRMFMPPRYVRHLLYHTHASAVGNTAHVAK